MRFITLVLVIISLIDQSCSYKVYTMPEEYHFCLIKRITLDKVTLPYYNFTIRNDSLFLLFEGTKITTKKIIKPLSGSQKRDTVIFRKEYKGIISKVLYLKDSCVTAYNNQGFEYSWNCYDFIPDKVKFDNRKISLKYYYPNSSIVEKVSSYWMEWIEFPRLIASYNDKIYFKNGRVIKFKSSAAGNKFVYHNYMYEIIRLDNYNYWLNLYDLTKLYQSAR